MKKYYKYFIVYLLFPTLSLISCFDTPTQNTVGIIQSIDTLTKNVNELSHSEVDRFKLFTTTNIWTFIQLDAITGQMWQIQFDVQGNNRGV